MKRQLKFYAILCSLALLTSCAENTNSHNDDGVSSGITDNSTDEDFIDLSELCGNEDKYISDIYLQTYDNLIFSENIDPEIPEKIGIYKVTERDDLDSYKDKIFDKYIPESVFDDSKVSYNDEEIYGKYYGCNFIDDETGAIITISNNGFINHINNNAQPLYEQRTNLYKTVYIGKKYDDEVLELINGTAKASELIETAKKELAGYSEVSDSELSFSPRWLNIYTDPESGKQYCIIEFSEDYKDIMLTPTCDGTTTIDVEKQYTTGASVMYTSPESSDGFVIQADLVTDKTVSEQDKILSPAAAAQIAGNTLSGYKKYTVTDVALTYLPITDMSLDSEETLTMTLTPYWDFVIADESADNGHAEKAVYVNCFTGEVETIL